MPRHIRLLVVLILVSLAAGALPCRSGFRSGAGTVDGGVDDTLLVRP